MVRISKRYCFDDLTTFYTLEITDSEWLHVKLDEHDRALLQDIEKGPVSDTPVADILMGLETLARRMEERGRRRSKERVNADESTLPCLQGCKAPGG